MTKISAWAEQARHRLPKPRLFRGFRWCATDHCGKPAWLCCMLRGPVGRGGSPAEAFDDWAEQMARRGFMSPAQASGGAAITKP